MRIICFNKTRLSFLKTIICLTAILSCAKKESNEPTKSFSKPSNATYLITDSIPLFNDTLAYSQIFPQKLLFDSILVYQYPQLNLSLINKKGKLLKTISKKGDLKGEFSGDYLFPFWGSDGNLYILEEGNSSKITIFDKSLNFLKSIVLTHHLSDKFVPAVESIMDVKIVSDKIIKATITCGDVTRPTFAKEYYEKGNSFAEITINRKDFSVIDVQYKLPYTDFEIVNNSLDENKRYWHSPFGRLVRKNKSLFIKYNFDNKLYEYDDNWKMIHEYQLNPSWLSKSENFSRPFDNFKEEKDVETSMANQHSFEFSNINYNSFKIVDNTVFIIYKKPVMKDLLPISTKDYVNYSPTPVLHILNLSNKKEYNIDLTTKFTAYREIFVENPETVYIMGNPNLSEDVYLYKLHISYE